MAVLQRVRDAQCLRVVVRNGSEAVTRQRAEVGEAAAPATDGWLGLVVVHAVVAAVGQQHALERRVGDGVEENVQGWLLTC